MRRTWRWAPACGCVLLLAVAGCGSSDGTAGAVPSWAAALGPRVAVQAPVSEPVNGSPQAVVTEYVRALDARDFTGACGFAAPADQAACKAEIAGNGSQHAMPPADTYNGFSVGYTLIDGRQALVGATGQLCVLTQAQTCVSNADPAAVLDSGKSFAALWTQAVDALSGAYSPIPCVQVRGTWYLDTAGV